MLFDTYQWYKTRHANKNKISSDNSSTTENNDAGHKRLSFKSYLQGSGEGKRKIGKTMDLQEDVYSTLYCGLVKAEYV